MSTHLMPPPPLMPNSRTSCCGTLLSAPPVTGERFTFDRAQADCPHLGSPHEMANEVINQLQRHREAFHPGGTGSADLSRIVGLAVQLRNKLDQPEVETSDPPMEPDRYCDAGCGTLLRDPTTWNPDRPGKSYCSAYCAEGPHRPSDREIELREAIARDLGYGSGPDETWSPVISRRLGRAARSMLARMDVERTLAVAHAEADAADARQQGALRVWSPADEDALTVAAELREDTRGLGTDAETTAYRLAQLLEEIKRRVGEPVDRYPVAPSIHDIAHAQDRIADVLAREFYGHSYGTVSGSQQDTCMEVAGKVLDVLHSRPQTAQEPSSAPSGAPPATGQHTGQQTRPGTPPGP